MSRRHSALSVAAAVLTGLSVWGIFIWRARTVTLTTERLCGVIAQIIFSSDRSLGTPGSSSVDYFREHPSALKAAHRENRVILASLPCQPPPREEP